MLRRSLGLHCLQYAAVLLGPVDCCACLPQARRSHCVTGSTTFWRAACVSSWLPVPVAQALIAEAPAAGSMTGRQLLEALARGTEMHKAWEGGSGGSRRLVQVHCTCVLPCTAAIHGCDGVVPWALRGTPGFTVKLCASFCSGAHSLHLYCEDAPPGNRLHQHEALRLRPHTMPGL